jgi:hypothetical protein
MLQDVLCEQPHILKTSLSHLQSNLNCTKPSKIQNVKNLQIKIFHSQKSKMKSRKSEKLCTTFNIQSFKNSKNQNLYCVKALKSKISKIQSPSQQPSKFKSLIFKFKNLRKSKNSKSSNFFLKILHLFKIQKIVNRKKFCH